MSVTLLSATQQLQSLLVGNLTNWKDNLSDRQASNAFYATSGAVEIKRLSASNLPALVLHAADGERTITGNNKTARLTTGIYADVIWDEKEPSAAFVQEISLIESVDETIATAPRLGLADTQCRLVNWEFLQSASNNASIRIARILFDLSIDKHYA